MEGNYGVYWGQQLIGKVQVIQEGLYYRFICRCRFSGDIFCRLQVKCGNNQENLGVLIPIDNGFGLDTRIPSKRLGSGEMTFLLMPKHEKMQETFIPIYPEEPFAYLSRLKKAYLIRQNGESGILV